MLAAEACSAHSGVAGRTKGILRWTTRACTEQLKLVLASSACDVGHPGSLFHEKSNGLLDLAVLKWVPYLNHLWRACAPDFR